MKKDKIEIDDSHSSALCTMYRCHNVCTNKIYYMYILTSGDHLTGCLTADNIEMLAILQTNERRTIACMILITVHFARLTLQVCMAESMCTLVDVHMRVHEIELLLIL